MGLGISHDAWNAPYGRLTQWRQYLAELAGYAVWPVGHTRSDHKDEHYWTRNNGPFYCNSQVMLDWGHITDDNLHGKWEKDPEDPLVLIIAHHDDRGSLLPKHARMLADRLEELLPLIEPGVGGLPGYSDWLTTTEQFIAGARSAHKARQRLVFS